VSHKPGGKLPLLSTRPAFTPVTLKSAATNFAAWFTEVLWRKCPPLVLLTCVISILLYVNNVYLYSRAVREQRREEREERGEERGTGPPPPALGSYKSESRLQYRYM